MGVGGVSRTSRGCLFLQVMRDLIADQMAELRFAGQQSLQRQLGEALVRQALASVIGRGAPLSRARLRLLALRVDRCPALARALPPYAALRGSCDGGLSCMCYLELSCAVMCCAVLRCTALYCAVLRCTALCCCAVLRCAELY